MLYCLALFADITVNREAAILILLYQWHVVAVGAQKICYYGPIHTVKQLNMVTIY